jgi:hypothetical protein
MKRNMDLVRQILLALDEHETGYAPHDLQFEGFNEEQIGYHIYIMGQAGLLEVENVGHLDASSPSAMAMNLTWAGHEFLSNAREESNWLQAKKLMRGAGEGSFQIWQSVLTKVVMNGLSL